MRQRWSAGNRFSLLENGEQFFPRVFEAIASARREVLLETFILRADKVGVALRTALLTAAQRGAQIDFTVDGFGSPDLPMGFLAGLIEAGVRIHVFNPVPRALRRLHYFRRLHRKLVVIDGARAFVGGINFGAEHLADFGPEAKQDYAVEVEGPLVADIRGFMQEALGRARTQEHLRRYETEEDGEENIAFGNADASFVCRDNYSHPHDIERHYRLAIRLARSRVMIANAYFFPGYAFLRDLRNAARRGVQVSLILQGKPDMPIVQTAAAMLYEHLLDGGVRIYEYLDRPLHAKVALVDDEWSTVGSSNLDPLSLAFNLEANVMIRDRAFNHALSGNLQNLMARHCRRIEAVDCRESDWRRKLRSFFLFHALRRYPAWAGRLPAHAPRLKRLGLAPKNGTRPALDKTACP
jgi:cardiolipin synthase